MTCRWPFFTLLVAVFLGSCKTPLRTSQLSDLTAEQEQEILGYAYDEAFREADHPRDTLGLETRKIHAIGPHCGYRDSHLKIFKESVDGLRGYFTENVWRRYPIPRVGQDCGPGETLENGYCWQSYGLQFYPSDKRNNTSARTISNTSPLIRLVQKQSYPEDTAACRIDGKNVLIWVGGIRNPKMGTSWQNTDKELLGAIMAWHSRPSLPVLPGGNNKLRGELAYIQLVENNGAYVSGILGKHDEVAIRRLANNLKLAYVAGAHGVEIISHSNGAITTQMGLQLFLDEMSEQNSASLRAGRRQVEGAPTKMDINIFHIQGAPSQKWSLSALNTFKSYSDFLRNAVWVRKTRLGIPYWGWDWDFSVHRKASALTNLKIRFFYNRPDYLTFPIFNLVGRSKSLAWQKEVNQNGVSRGVTTHIEHFKCSDSRVAQCGPGHKQREVLWSFADPAQSIPWNSELQTPPSGNEGRAAMARAAFLPESADLALEPKQMPEVVCVDMTQHADYCRRNFNPEGLAQRESPDQGPLFLCSDPEDLDHPCSQINASDGMCSLVERDGREFERECYFPKYLTFCQCVGGNCEKTVVSCRNEICDVNSSAADDCSCRVNSQPVTCDPRADYCRIETGREGGACLRAQTFSADPGSARSEICRDEQCLTADPALERADALPQGVRAFGGAERFDQLPASSEVEPR